MHVPNALQLDYVKITAGRVTLPSLTTLGRAGACSTSNITTTYVWDGSAWIWPDVLLPSLTTIGLGG